MKKHMVILFIAFLLILPLVSVAELVPDDMFDLSDGVAVGEAFEVSYTTDNQLTQEYDTAEIHSYTCQELDNGYFRFTVEYTMPEGLNVSVFDPPGGRRFMMIGKGTTHSGRSLFQFEISGKKLQKADMVNINFHSSDKNRFFVSFKTDDYQLEPDPFTLSKGTLIGTEHDLNYRETNELQRESDQAVIHSCRYQKLNNDLVRFTIDYTMPEGLKINVFNPNGWYISLKGRDPIPSGRNTFQFDLQRDAIMKSRVVVVDFSSGDAGSYTVSFWLEENSIFIDLDELASAEPVGKEQKIKYVVSNELASGKKRAKIHRFVSQEYDNGYILFTVDYTMPEGMKISAFDDEYESQGERLNLISNAVTSSGKGTYQFCVKKTELLSFQGLSVSFYTEDQNRFFLSFSNANQ